MGNALSPMEGRWGQVTNDNVRASGLIPTGTPVIVLGVGCIAAYQSPVS